jgi:hypothetical protein
MHYLIDGHNLIAKMPDISLDDPNDEMKLVLRLKSWASASRKRQATVIFDQGMPGGKSLRFSSSSVKVLFASVGSSADEMLIRRIWRIKNPSEYTLISSDQQIIAAARARHVPVMRSEEFAPALAKESATAAAEAESASPGTAEKPQISEEEVAEWLALFGPEPDPVVRRRNVSPVQTPEKGAAPEKKPSRRRSLTIDKNAERKLDSDEVDEWLDLFKSGGT